MKLYKVPRKTYVRILEDNVFTPPGAYPLKKNDIIFFDHVDGMYSFCRDLNNNIVHLATYTNVEIVEEDYFVPDQDAGNENDNNDW